MKKLLLTIILLVFGTQAYAWTNTQKVDDFEGTTIFYSAVTSGSASLYVRTKKKVGEYPTDVFYSPGDSYICDSSGSYGMLENVQYKFDNESIKTTNLSLSTDNTSLFFLEYELKSKNQFDDFVKGLKNSKSLAIRYHDGCGQQETVTFMLGNNEPHINWETSEMRKERLESKELTEEDLKLLEFENTLKLAQAENCLVEGSLYNEEWIIEYDAKWHHNHKYTCGKKVEEAV